MKNQINLKRQYPTSFDLRRRAQRRMPNFSFEYMDGGAGADVGIERNWKSLDSMELVPRYGKVTRPPPTNIELFGRTYSAPIGIAPIGSPSTAFPGAEKYLAKAAQVIGIPYTLGIMSGIDIEETAKIAPDVFWFQLYRFPLNDHAIGFDMVKRANAAGAHALILTIDTPTRTTRPREVKSGIMTPFRLSMRLRLDALLSPPWMLSMFRNGIPRFACFKPYLPKNADIVEATKFIQREGGGAFTWEEIARYRDKWKKPMLVKGILHPKDAERAVSLGLDGIVVTNHGGRQIEALPASIDVLPEIASTVGKNITIIFDSGIRSGIDVARAIAAGADSAFSGKAFLWSLGALGEVGPKHMANTFIEEIGSTLGQLGCEAVSDLHEIQYRHPTAYKAKA